MTLQRKISIQKRQRLVNVEQHQRKKFVDQRKGNFNRFRFVFLFQKGFGAQKVTADFKEIERNAQEQEKMREQQVLFDAKTREENEKQIEKQMFVFFSTENFNRNWESFRFFLRAGLKFAYQDLNKQRDVQEAKLKQSNPQKAEQVERLGMGFANRRWKEKENFVKNFILFLLFSFSGGISHSAMTDMQTIEQEGVTNTRNISLATKNRDFFDEFSTSRSSKWK